MGVLMGTMQLVVAIVFAQLLTSANAKKCVADNARGAFDNPMCWFGESNPGPGSALEHYRHAFLRVCSGLNQSSPSGRETPAQCGKKYPCHMFNNKKVPSTGGLLLTHDATKKPMSTVAKRSIKKDSQEWLLTMWIRRDRDPKNWRIQDPRGASWRFGWPNWDNEIPARKCRGWRGRHNKKCGAVKQRAEGKEMGGNGKKGWGSAVYKQINVGWGYNRFNGDAPSAFVKISGCAFIYTKAALLNNVWYKFGFGVKKVCDTKACKLRFEFYVNGVLAGDTSLDSCIYTPGQKPIKGIRDILQKTTQIAQHKPGDQVIAYLRIHPEKSKIYNEMRLQDVRYYASPSSSELISAVSIPQSHIVSSSDTKAWKALQCDLKHGRFFVMADAVKRTGYCAVVGAAMVPSCVAAPGDIRICTKAQAVILNSGANPVYDPKATTTSIAWKKRKGEILPGQPWGWKTRKGTYVAKDDFSSSNVFLARLRKTVYCKGTECQVKKEGVCFRCPLTADYATLSVGMRPPAVFNP